MRENLNEFIISGVRTTFQDKDKQKEKIGRDVGNMRLGENIRIKSGTASCVWSWHCTAQFGPLSIVQCPLIKCCIKL